MRSQHGTGRERRAKGATAVRAPWARRRFTLPLALVLGAVAPLGLTLGACSGPGPKYEPASNPTVNVTPAPPACGSPSPGCPCTSEGTSVSCGDVIHYNGPYVSCSPGTMVCGDAGLWGACTGEVWGQRQQFGPCASNPCDPLCRQITDQPSDVDASTDSGLVNNGDDGGVTLLGIVGSQSIPCTALTSTPAAVSLTVTAIPPDAGAIVFTVASPAPNPPTFAATFSPAACYTGNAPAAWTVDNPTISTVSSTGVFNLVDPRPGPVHVVAHSGSFTTGASPSTVNVTVNAVDLTSAPSGFTTSSFTAGTAADSITVLYPYNNTVLPLGQLAPTIQWDNGGVPASAVMVQLRYPAGSGSSFKWSGVMPESQAQPTPVLAKQPRAFIPQPVWTAFERAAAGGTADFVIQRITGGDGGVGGTVLQPNPPVNLIFATDQLKGTVYYQSYGTNLALNFSGAYNGGQCTNGNACSSCTAPNFCINNNFGAATLAIHPGATAPVLVAGDSNNCRVCHSVAASGASLITQSNNSSDQDSWFYNLVANTTTDMGVGPTSDGTFSWPAISPDGTYLLSNSGPLSGAASNGVSKLYSAPTGAAISGVTGLQDTLKARRPSFSPDAAHVAFQYYGGGATNCKAGAASCASASECCSNACANCAAAAALCSNNYDCCSGSCNACVAAGTACSAGTDCCSGSCQCGAGAASCTANTDCCSNNCLAPGGTSCTANSACSSNNCVALSASGTACASGATCSSGTCGTCVANGVVATVVTDCCSGTWNSSNHKCGSAGSRQICLGNGTNGTCSGSTTARVCGAGGTANMKCVGGAAGKHCTGGTAGKQCLGGADQKSLAAIDYSPTSKAFSNLQTLATPGASSVGTGSIYYPSYLPQAAARSGSNAIVWHLETVYNTRTGSYGPGETRSQCDGRGPTACQNDGTHAELWWTDVATKTSARLDRLNGLGYLPLHPTFGTASGGIPSGGLQEASSGPSTADPTFNYEPTVLPQVSGGYAWVVFTSRRRYGNIATINPFWSDPRYQDLSVQPTPKKLWVAAIDLNAPAGTDPSHPAFYLGGQELLAGNSRAYWVLSQCTPAGTSDANLCSQTLDCCSPAVCSLDGSGALTKHCTSPASTTCTNLSAACTTDNQCCGYPTSVCAQGTCQAPQATLTYAQAQFTQDYDATDKCVQGSTRATWVDVGLEAKFPPSSGGRYPSIKIYAQVGNSLANLRPTTPMLVGTMTGPPQDQTVTWTNWPIVTTLGDGGAGYALEPYLRLTVQLVPSSDTLSAPILLDWRARFDCTPFD